MVEELNRTERAILAVLTDLVLQGQCVLFLGAGVSLELGLPSGWELMTALAQDFGGKETTLSQVAEDYQTIFDRSRLVTRVRQLVEQQPVQPDQVTSYDLLPEIKPLSHLIFTTNWDNHIRQSFERKTIPLTTVKYNEQVRSLTSHPHIVVKLHGDFDCRPDEIVLTRTDYLRAYKEVSKIGGLFTLLAEKLATATILFIGYSLEDDDFRLLYSYICDALKASGHTHYAVMSRASSLLKKEWQRRNVMILDLTAHQVLEYIAHQVRDFINRDTERKFVTRPDSGAFTEFTGFAGSGKSELLRKIKEEFRLGGTWLHALVNFDEQVDISPLDLARELGRQTRVTGLDNLEPSIKEELGEELRSLTPQELSAKVERRAAELLNHNWRTRRVVVLFDSTEQLALRSRRWLEDVLIPAMEADNGDLQSQLRFVFAGRRPIAWQKLHLRGLHFYQLSPFDEAAVGEMLDWYAALTVRNPVARPKRKQLIQDILDLSGGHPACIKRVIEELVAHKFDVTSDFIRANRKNLFSRIVYPIVEEGILKKLPLDLRPVFEITCVFRRLMPDFLDVLIQNYLDNSYGHGLGLLGRLRETYLVSRPQAPAFMYDNDPLVRQILSSHIELTNFNRFQELNRLAYRIYERSLDRATLQGEVTLQELDGDLKVSFIIEAIYHQLVQARLDDLPARQLEGQLRLKMPHYLNLLNANPRDYRRLWELLSARLGGDSRQVDKEVITLAGKLIPGLGNQFLLELVMAVQ